MAIDFTLLSTYRLLLGKIMLICLIYIPITSYAFHEDPLKDSLALDKNIHYGRLQNGFTYYLKSTKDTDKINLRFYVKVGRFNEELRQSLQFSHLLEHLGCANWYMKSYHSKIDASFKNSGRTTSANTSHLHTTYWSDIQNTDNEALKDRLEWFYYISNMKLVDSVVIREIRCVRQEKFFKGEGFGITRSYNNSVRDEAIFFNTCGKTPYMNWINPHDMKKIAIPSLRQFYHHWYRPDRMGLVITGNIPNIDSLEKQLIALFSKIPKRAIKSGKFDRRLLYLSSPQKVKSVKRLDLNRFDDWNITHSYTSLFFRVKNFHRQLNSKEKWLNEKLYMAMYRMIYQRLKDSEIIPWSTKKGGSIDMKLPNRDTPYLRLPIIENKPGKEQENIQRVTCILQKLFINGFTQMEWRKQKLLLLNQINSWDDSSSKYWENQLKNNFVYGEILPVQKKAISKTWIDNLTLKDINSYLDNNFCVMPDDIYITASSGHPALSYTKSQVQRWIKEAINQPVEVKKNIDISSLTPISGVPTPLMVSKETDGLKKIGYRKIEMDPDTGLEVLQLNNGVKIILNQKDPKKNASPTISITGSSPRGASCFPLDLYYSAISAPEIVKLSGVRAFSKEAIRDKLGGRFPLNTVPVQLHIKNNTSTVSTRVEFEELEKYLQLVFLYFTSPRKDTLAFSEWKLQINRRYFGGITGGVSPRIDMKNEIAKFLNLSDFGTTTDLISTEQFYQKQNVSYESAMECYQAIFGNAIDFTFVIKGEYEKEKVLPLLQKYLGNLPTNNNTFCSNVNTSKNIQLPKGPVYHTFYADKMKTGYKLYTVPYMLSYVFPIPNENWKERIVMDVIIRYFDQLIDRDFRYTKGLSIYYNTVEGQYLKKDNLYSLTIHVDALDDELERIRKEVKNNVIDIKYRGIGTEEKNRIIENPLFYGKFEYTPRLKEKVLQYARSLTSLDIIKVANKYLTMNNQYEFAFRESK